MWAPLRAARLAASTLVIMPPRPMWLPAPPAINSSFGVASLCLADERCAGVFARVGGEQADLVGEDDQGIGFDQVGDQRTQGVVVAELDLVGDHGVVLVDDGDHAQREQGAQGGAGVQIAFAVGEVGVGQQHLCRMDLMLAEAALIYLHQTHLSDRCCCLQFVHRAGALFPAQALHAFGDGAGRHQHHFASTCAQGSDLLRPIAESTVIQSRALIGDQAAADFDDDAFGFG